jgi:hypothetical protein
MENPPATSDPHRPGSFINRVNHLRKADWGMNTDFFKALKMVLDTLVSHSVPPVQVKNLVLAVFSDMQIDEAKTETGTPQSMHSRIQEMYEEHGYEAPHILYWNLRTTNGFPSASIISFQLIDISVENNPTNFWRSWFG